MAEQKATDILMAEHRGIERMLNVVEAAAARVERGEPVPPALFADAAAFFANFADRCHHSKEEQHLFKTMAERGIPVEGGPIGVMLAEHEQGRAYVRAMREEGDKYAAGTLKDPHRLVEAVRGYAGLLRQHIMKEDRVLYPMAERVLTPMDQTALVEACERVEREEMGEGEHERFHAMIEQLEREMAIERA
ncbi:MAG TPA: hemerythrin domain-containing protein [Anaerolineae bacterium]|nr:hemerythrin domain-containing protein [Anaerolineae bacterium]HOQ99926.1 hemerythrin domain-containing protein [Anaerolineae bacterium]HPL26845.1 hemerythrin domain-containing protein [Anaerolineae bacterium]